LFIELNQRAGGQHKQKFMNNIWIFFSSIEGFESNIVCWEVAQIVVISEDFQNRI